MRRLGILAIAVGCSSSTTTPIPGPSPDGGAPLTDGSIPISPDAMTVDAPPGTPTVTATSPADGASGVAPDGAITATFSADMNPATITTSTFTVSGISGTVTYANRVATFTPSARLPLDATETATLSTAITDAAGQPLAVAVTWSFTTRDGQWTTPARITSDPGGKPVVAMSAAGAIALAPAGGHLYAQTTGAATSIADGYITDPAVAIDGSGNATVAWIDVQSNANDLWSRRYVNGAWDTPQLLETDDASQHSAGAPSLAVDAAGDVTIVWYQEYSGAQSHIWARRLVPGSGWGAPTQLGDGFAPVIAVNSSGDAAVVWDELIGSGANMWGATFTPSGGWTPATMLANADAFNFEPQVAIDASGNAIAVWRHAQSVWSARFAGSWTAGAQLSDSGFADFPSVGIDASGDAIAIWTTDTGLVTRTFSGGSWTAITMIGTASTDGFTALSVLPDGDAIALWTRDRVLNEVREHAGAWGASTPIDTTDPGVSEWPVIAGDAIAAWSHSDGPVQSGTTFHAYRADFE